MPAPRRRNTATRSDSHHHPQTRVHLSAMPSMFPETLTPIQNSAAYNKEIRDRSSTKEPENGKPNDAPYGLRRPGERSVNNAVRMDVKPVVPNVSPSRSRDHSGPKISLTIRS